MTAVDVASAGMPDPGSELHDAVRRGDCTHAARLLASGADPMHRDARGRAPLDPEHVDLEVLHRIRQEYLRLPLTPYDTEVPEDPWLSQLRSDGIAKLEGSVPPPQLRKLRTEFARWVRHMRLLRLGRKLAMRRWSHRYDQKHYWHGRQRSYTTNDALHCAPSLLALARDPRLVDLASRYLRRPVQLRRAYAMRYLPAVEMEESQFRWHHDMEDRQLKVMILLTDVPEDGQYMTYVRGSHRRYHAYRHFVSGGLDLDYCREYLDEIEIVRATGRAGDVVLFDSNGLHSGNRALTSTRDAIFLEYSGDPNAQNLWGTQLRRSKVPRVADGPDPLASFLSVVPSWQRPKVAPRRKHASWAHSLGHPDRWV